MDRIIIDILREGCFKGVADPAGLLA